MADSTTNIPQVTEEQAQKATTVNQLIDACGPASVFARNAETCVGLTWGYLGGRWGGTSIANGTVTLTASSTNYVVFERSSGTVSVATTTTNWNDTATYGRLYKITAGSTTVSSYEDHRAGGSGLQPSGDVVTGKHAVPVVAGSMRPSSTGGCAALALVAIGSGQPDISTLDFDAASEEYAQFCIPMPKSWNKGTITFKAYWSHASTTVNFGVVWGLQAVAISDVDGFATSFGTAQTAADTGGTTNSLYISAESSAITVAAAGSPTTDEDLVFFRVFRKVSDGSDTMAIDARLHAIVLFINTDAATDA